ncbi:ligand-gated channel [Methyloprofundus sedimenti]|uniref:Ligand-gated channel n=1 Tax=Methyloprofundus sedimenti TaxID=1420851 RepID=A0A1V8M4F6_9GAMM|nr:TonB-dependent receptor [Methyloprofundus sedimenti]OQK16431.1 ligand-gated channel [Methyloprofundus sedimenti]
MHSKTSNSRLQYRHVTAGLLSVAISTVVNQPLYAEQQSNLTTRYYNIPSQSLDGALTELADQAGLKLLYPAEVVSNKQSQPLSGNYSPKTALETLLRDSSLDYRFTDDQSVTVQKHQKSMDDLLKIAASDEYRVDATGGGEEDYTGPVEQEDLTVSGRELSGYNVINANSATKTDTPILETPVSIQVVPRAVMNDQKTTTIKGALENVSSVRPQSSLGLGNGFIIRGFHSDRVYRNGLVANGLSTGRAAQFDSANLERVEVLKGPAAVLFGRIEPGGLINLVTKKPQDESYYSLEQRFGSYDFYRTEWDATGAITDDNSLSYRFNGSYQNNKSFRDFNFNDRVQVNPSVTWRPSDATEMSLDVEVLHENYQVDRGLFAIGDRPAPIPITRSFIDPNDPVDTNSKVYLGFNFTHAFNADWTIRNRFLASFVDSNDISVKPANAFTVAEFLDPSSGNRTYLRNIFSQIVTSQTYTTNLDLTGNLELWGTNHQTLIGIDYLRSTGTYLTRGNFREPVPGLGIDIYNPVYGIDPSFYANALATPFPPGSNHSYFRDEWYGVYFQDHITLWDKLHILGGGRYDWATTGRGKGDSFSAAEADLPSRKDEGFSPRVGILYQPWAWASVYGNWTTSFGANNGITATGATINPEVGEQFEVGLKTELFDQRLTTTLAYYHLTKENIMTSDFNSPDPLAKAAIGEARSQGIELDMSGQITDELSVIGNYAYTDARITKDFSGLQGNRLSNVPEHSGSLWLKYDIHHYEPLNGLSFGMGVFAASQREGDDANTFVLPGYVRLDAFASYAYQLGDSRLIAQFNIRNLLDKTYYESTDPFQNAPPRVGIYPGAPLTAIGSIRLEY